MIGICCLCVILILCLICVLAIKHLMQSLKTEHIEPEKKGFEKKGFEKKVFEKKGFKKGLEKQAEKHVEKQVENERPKNSPLNVVDSSQRKMYGGSEEKVVVTIEDNIVKEYPETLAKIAYKILNENNGKYEIPDVVKDGTKTSFEIKPFYNNIILKDLLEISKNSSGEKDEEHAIKFSEMFTKSVITTIIGNSEITVKNNIKDFEEGYKELFNEFEVKYEEFVGKIGEVPKITPKGKFEEEESDVEGEEEPDVEYVEVPDEDIHKHGYEDVAEEDEEDEEDIEDITPTAIPTATPKIFRGTLSGGMIDGDSPDDYTINNSLEYEIKETIEITILRLFVKYITYEGTDDDKRNEEIENYLDVMRENVSNINKYVGETIETIDKKLPQVLKEESDTNVFEKLTKEQRETYTA